MSQAKGSRIVLIVVSVFGFALPAAAGTERFVPTVEYPTIQDAIGACVDGDIVTVYNSEQAYTGTGFRDLNFGGLAITVRSP